MIAIKNREFLESVRMDNDYNYNYNYTDFSKLLLHQIYDV